MKINLIALVVAASAACCNDAGHDAVKSVTSCEAGVRKTPPRATASANPPHYLDYVEQQEQPPAEPKEAVSDSNPSKSALRSKRGLAYNDGNLANSFGDRCEACSWGYNWFSRRQDLNPKYDFVPTLWGTHVNHTSIWEQNARDMISEGSKAVFSFNEPDKADQSNLSPSEAALGHQRYMNPFAGRVLVGAPSVSNSDIAGEGLEWLQQFVNECGGKCEIDFCNVHWYHEYASAETLFEHVEAAHRICNGKPIWLTEFGLVDSTPSQTEDFVKSTIPRLEKIDYLTAYSYFMVSEGRLTSNGQPSSYGELYASLP